MTNLQYDDKLAEECVVEISNFLCRPMTPNEHKKVGSLILNTIQKRDARQNKRDNRKNYLYP